MPWRAPAPARDPNPAFTYAEAAESDSDRLASFRRRQQEDLHRRSDGLAAHRRRLPFHQRFDEKTGAPRSADADPEAEGEEAWRTSEGERLGDFGVDEDVEFYDEENVPLAQVARRARAARQVS